MEVWICTRDLYRFIPREGVRASHRIPMKLHEARLALVVHEPEGVNAESLHHSIAAGDRSIGHEPHQHVGRFWHQRYEIPERVMGRGSLRHTMMWLRLYRMDQIWELHRVLNEEDRDVVANQIPSAFIGIEFHS